MNDITAMSLKKARAEVQQEVVSENMLGISFSIETEQVIPTIKIATELHNFGYLEMEFKKGDF